MNRNINMNTAEDIAELEQNLVKMQTELDAMKAILTEKKEGKFELRQGEYYNHTYEGGFDFHMSHCNELTEHQKKHFNSFSTEKKAFLAIKHYIITNKLINFVDEYGGNWVADWNNHCQRKFYVYFNFRTHGWEDDSNTYHRAPEKIYMSGYCVQKLCEYANTGRIDLGESL